MSWRNWVHPLAVEVVEQEHLLQDLASDLSDLFTISWASVHATGRVEYLQALLRPNRRAQATLMTDREIACVIAPYADIEVRAVAALTDLIDRHNGRADPRICVLVHSDPNGNDRLKAWGDEKSLSLISVYRSPRKGLPQRDALLRTFGSDLYRHDPFAKAEPVASDTEFFGRRNDVDGLLRSLARGEARSLFALRRAGKTSIINRLHALASSSGEACVAMVDGSQASVHSLDADGLLGLVGSTVRQARLDGYASAASVVNRGKESLVAEFDRADAKPVIVVFDEVDDIGPTSEAADSWSTEFVPFWRAFRAAYQEARRRDNKVGVLVSGVSSLSFRAVEVGGKENPVLGFVAEGYLEPFGLTQTAKMLRSLGQRCGLRLDDSACLVLYEACGGFPYWLRLAGSALHRGIPLEGRPVDLDGGAVQTVMNDFLLGEGLENAEQVLRNLERRDTAVVDALRTVKRGAAPDDRAIRRAAKYGLADLSGPTPQVRSSIVGLAATRLAPRSEGLAASPPSDSGEGPLKEAISHQLLALHEPVERGIRVLVRGALKTHSPTGWQADVLKAIPEHRRRTMVGKEGDDLMAGLFFSDLKLIILENWARFEKIFRDKARFVSAMEIANDREFAHPAELDLAHLALYRREYEWLRDAAA